METSNPTSLKQPFKNWLKANGLGVSVDSYPRSVEAISMPLQTPMSKTTGSWEGVYEYVIGVRPKVDPFSVAGRHHFDSVYAKFSQLMSKPVQIPELGINPQRHQELIDYTLKSGTSIDKGRLYCAYNKYKEFLAWFDFNKSSFGFAEQKGEAMDNQVLSAIRTKPFILLAGISGTGKSRLVRQLARGLCPRNKRGSTTDDHPLYNKQKPGNFEMIQVRPNWHDSTQLMGYESRVSGKAEFVVKPFVKFLAKAWLYEEEGIPFFLCLDEMNLAPVEQYFAEYLSVIETRKTVGGKIVTDPLVTFPNEALLRAAFKEIYQGIDHNKVEPIINKFIADGGIPIPQNFIVMGTVNMDETTFSFSRKVLDRAMSFELNEVDMDGGLNADADYEFGSIDGAAAKCEFTQGFEVYAAAQDDCDKIKVFLVEVNKVLDKTPFKIAYRTRNEIMIYCHERTKYGVPLAQALDEATSMKILSRVEGDKRRLVVRDAELAEYNGKPLLESLLDVILKGLKAIRGGDADYTESDVCSKKLQEMIGQLENGYASFWTR